MAKASLKKTRVKRLPKAANGGIELLLVQAVDHLGKQGDVVTVKPGYALNYLLPQGLATFATEHHKRMVDKHRAELEQIEKARLAGLRTSRRRARPPERDDRGQRQRRRPSLRLRRPAGHCQRPEAQQVQHHAGPGPPDRSAQGAWPLHGQDPSRARRSRPKSRSGSCRRLARTRRSDKCYNRGRPRSV